MTEREERTEKEKLIFKKGWYMLQSHIYIYINVHNCLERNIDRLNFWIKYIPINESNYNRNAKIIRN